MRTQSQKKFFLIVLGFLFGSLVLLKTIYWTDIDFGKNNWHQNQQETEVIKTFVERIDFNGFDNRTGTGRLIVPNIIHYIRFNRTALTFVEYICLRSVYLHQKPERILVHTNVPDSSAANLSGEYWEKIRKDQPDLYDRITVLTIELPADVFGQPLSENWRVFHGSDVARIRTLMKYGGIYLDNDVFVVGNLDKYRHFEVALGWDEDQFLGNQVIVAHKDARFLPLWLDTYREYHPDLWYYNAGEHPTRQVLMRSPELIHRVKLRFGVHMLMRELYGTKEWEFEKEQDTIHLLINHRSYLDPHFQNFPEFNPNNIISYPFSFGRMARLVL